MFKVSAETMLTIAADKKHLGARVGIRSVLRTWGSFAAYLAPLHTADWIVNSNRPFGPCPPA